MINTVATFLPGGTAGQPPTAPPGGGYTPTRGRGLPLPLPENGWN